MYLNTTDGTVYKKTGTSTWTVQGVSIKGPQGIQGATGATGATGPTGATGSAGVSTVVVSAGADNTTVTATCTAGRFAIGGGGQGATGHSLTASFPSTSGGVAVTTGSATSWTAIFDSSSGSTNNTAFVTCVS